MTDPPGWHADPVAEQRVIGAAVFSAGRATRDVRLTEEDFATPAHGELWVGLARYQDTGKPLTPDLFVAYVRDHKAALLPALLACLSSVGVPDEACWHADRLRTLTARRRLVQASTAIGQVASSMPDATPEELAEMARSQVDRFTNRSLTGGGAITFGDAFAGSMERWAKPDRNVLPTGWRDLDSLLTGGLRPGHLCVVGARPAVGKSLLATELARQVASSGNRVLFHSLEMTTEEVVDRIASSVSRVPLATLTGGTANDRDMDALADALAVVADWPLIIDDRPAITVTGIRGKARDVTREGPLGLLIVDYLQLVTPADPKANREQQVASVSRGLKLVSKDLGVPVLAVAQVNRGAADRRPTMSDLRESGAIEADADEILLLHRDDSQELYGQLEVNVVKNRHGSTGTTNLVWLPAGGRIGNLR